MFLIPFRFNWIGVGFNAVLLLAVLALEIGSLKVSRLLKLNKSRQLRIGLCQVSKHQVRPLIRRNQHGWLLQVRPASLRLRYHRLAIGVGSSRCLSFFQALLLLHHALWLKFIVTLCCLRWRLKVGMMTVLGLMLLMSLFLWSSLLF